MPSLGKILDTVEDAVTKIGELPDDLSAKFTGEDFITALARAAGPALTRIAAELANAIADPLADVTPALSDAVENIAEKVGEVLISQLGDIGNFPNSIAKGPQDALALVRDVAAVNFDPDLGTRAGLVVHSIEELVAKMLPGDLGIVSGAVKGIGTLIELAIAGDGAALTDFLVRPIFPGDSLLRLLREAANGKLWAWADMPTGMLNAKLHEWINDDGSYKDVSTMELERQFRLRLISSFDHYFRERVATDTSRAALQASDTRISTSLLAELVVLFIDTVGDYVFEPIDFPLTFDFVDRFEDLGAKFAEVYSRQIQAAVRSTIGILFRGFWEFSVHNEALIELIGASIGSLFATLVKGALKNLFWSLEVRATYDEPEDADGYWQSCEQFIDNAGATKRLWYSARRRSDGALLSTFASDVLLNAAKDYSAYQQAMYSTFGTRREFPSVSIDSVSISEAVFDTGRKQLTVAARSTNTGTKPIMRLYFGRRLQVMTPPLSDADPDYRVTLTFDELPRRFYPVTVVSSDGGLETVPVDIR